MELFLLKRDGYDHSQVHDGIRSYAEQHRLRWHIHLIPLDNQKILRAYADHNPSQAIPILGLITDEMIVPLRITYGDRLKVFSASGFCSDEQAWVVHVDEASIGQQAIDHLLQAGYKHLACWGSWEMGRRETVFTAAEKRCREYGMPLHRLILPRSCSNITEQDVTLKNLLDELPRPLGVITAQDSDAAYVATSCHRINLSIPDPIGVIGADNNPNVCRGGPLALSSVRVPWRTFGHKLARLCHQAASSSPPPRDHRLPAYGAHQRHSTSLQAQTIADPLVRRFVTKAQRAAINGKGIKDILPALGTSYQTLQRHVQQSLGQTPSDYMTDLRITKACDLLKTTTLSLAEVAKRSGFANAKRLHSAFVARYPVPPGTWRQG